MKILEKEENEVIKTTRYAGDDNIKILNLGEYSEARSPATITTGFSKGRHRVSKGEHLGYSQKGLMLWTDRKFVRERVGI